VKAGFCASLAATVAASVFLLCLVEALGSSPRVVGDSAEYLAYVHNLARGHGPNIAEVPPELTDRFEPKLRRLLDGQGQRLGAGTHVEELIRDKGGSIITWHWWGYSALSLPAYVLVTRIGAAPGQAFVATNFAFLSLLLVYLAAFSRQSMEFRALFACMFMLSGTSFYVWWIHPEVMTATLAALGLVAWLDRRLLLGIFCVALAATQNPPLVLLSVFPFLGVARSWLAAGGSSGWRRNALGGVVLTAAVCISLAPGAWYLHRVGVTNPILSAGAARFEAANLTKSLDLLFDLSQGMVLLQGFTFAFLGVFLARGVLRWHSFERRDKVTVLRVLALLAVTSAMAVLAAGAQNWNPGISVISRYSYWLTVPVIVAAGLAVEALGPGRARQRTAFLLIISGVSLVAYWGPHGKESSHVEFTVPAKIAMRIFPASYFPHPEVFCERAQGGEGCLFDRAYVYGLDDHRPIRVLVDEKFVVAQCEGKSAIEVPTKVEQYDGRTLLWFSGTVTCPSGLRIDRDRQ
jgi:hypothetical protein